MSEKRQSALMRVFTATTKLSSQATFYSEAASEVDALLPSLFDQAFRGEL